MYKPWSFLSALVCAGIVMMAHGVSADPPVQSTSAVATPAEQNAARLAQKNAVQWTIRDADGRPIPDASVDVYLWNGHYQHLGLSAVSNHEGIATIEGISQNGFSYARIGKAGFVADMMELVINSNRERLQTITLQSPVRSTIEVCDANGMPIAGAELTWLQYTSNNGNANVLTKSAASDLGLTWGKSDANGVLELPPLPLDVALKLTIFHPDYVSQSFSELRVRSGLLSAATLNQGVRMEIKLRHQDGSVVKDGAPMEVVLFPQTGSINESGIRHQINVRDGKLSMTVQPKNFNELRVRSEDFYVGPMLHNFLDRPNPILDLSDGESAAIELTAYPKRKLSGRVVDAEGNPKPGVHVSAMLVSPDPEHASRSFESIKELGLEQATALEGADTDKDGRYELEVTGGTVQLEVIATGFYSVPETTLLAVTDVEPAVADDIVLLPVPVLTGVVVDPDGEPMPGMICKVVSDGFGDALPVKASGPAGKFRLALSRIPYRRDAGGLDYVAYVMAFHPGKLLGGITQVDLRKPQQLKKIVVEVSTVEPGWTLNRYTKADSNEEVSDENPNRAARLADLVAERAEQLSEGLPGRVPPDLSEGTWLNAGQSSLSGLKGKFVLLDFWFIGCGPCHRDLPTIALAHKMFDPNRFAVVTVHTNSMAARKVKAFCERTKITYPVVVDNADGDISRAYRPLGVNSYPHYMLIDPEGKIVINDALLDGPSLRQHKLELIHREILSWDWGK